MEATKERNNSVTTNLEPELCSSFYDSPVGKLRLVASRTGIRAILWPADESSERVQLADMTIKKSKYLDQCAEELDSYFAGEVVSFSTPLDVQGTEFQKSVWKQLAEIPSGATVSYLDVAKRLGSPNSVRAVASAVGKNPVSIVMPCHRVVGSDGSLTGFAGGLDAKAKLLDLEAI